MANKKRFKSPVQIGVRIEKEVRDKLDTVTDNKSNWINKAIAEKLERDKNER